MRSIFIGALASMIGATAAEARFDQFDLTVHRIKKERDVSRIILSVRNNGSRTVEMLLFDCSLYDGGTPSGAENGVIENIVPGDEVVKELISFNTDFDEARCRVTDVDYE